MKDIILPGDMKVILAKVVEAEKAAQANVKIQSTFNVPRCRTLRNNAMVFSQPKHSSMRFLFF